MFNKKIELPFKVGDTVKGLFVADMQEHIGIDKLGREEVVTKIEEDGNGYFKVETDYTKSLHAKINAENEAITDENAQKKSTDWYIDARTANVLVKHDISVENLEKVGGTVEGRYVSFKHVQIPTELFSTLSKFVEYLEDKELLEIIDVDKEIVVAISGVEFTPGMLKSILNK